MMLKVLAVVVGVLVTVTRLLGVVSPELARRMIKLVLDRKTFALVMMVVVAIIGSLFVWGFRLYDHQYASHWAAYVLGALGVVMVVMALLGLVFPNLAFSLASKFYVMQCSRLRLLCLIGVVVGVVIILLGLCLPTTAPTETYACLD